MKRTQQLKTMFLPAISGVVLAVLFSLSGAQATPPEEAEQLVGTWQVQSTQRNCQTGAVLRTFPTLNIFAPGGSMLGTSAGASPALVSNAYGVWGSTRAGRTSPIPSRCCALTRTAPTPAH